MNVEKKLWWDVGNAKKTQQGMPLATCFKAFSCYLLSWTECLLPPSESFVLRFLSPAHRHHQQQQQQWRRRRRTHQKQ
jgi:hypothetical protein